MDKLNSKEEQSTGVKLPVMSGFCIHRAILFERKDGIYQDSYGNQITREMLMSHKHQIEEDEGILWLD